MAVVKSREVCWETSWSSKVDSPWCIKLEHTWEISTPFQTRDTVSKWVSFFLQVKSRVCWIHLLWTISMQTVSELGACKMRELKDYSEVVGNQAHGSLGPFESTSGLTFFFFIFGRENGKFLEGIWDWNCGTRSGPFPAERLMFLEVSQQRFRGNKFQCIQVLTVLI